MMAAGCVIQNIRRNMGDNIVRDSRRLAGVGTHPKLNLLLYEEDNLATVDRNGNRMKNQMESNTTGRHPHY